MSLQHGQNKYVNLQPISHIPTCSLIWRNPNLQMYLRYFVHVALINKYINCIIIVIRAYNLQDLPMVLDRQDQLLACLFSYMLTCPHSYLLTFQSCPCFSNYCIFTHGILFMIRHKRTRLDAVTGIITHDTTCLLFSLCKAYCSLSSPWLDASSRSLLISCDRYQSKSTFFDRDIS